MWLAPMSCVCASPVFNGWLPVWLFLEGAPAPLMWSWWRSKMKRWQLKVLSTITMSGLRLRRAYCECRYGPQLPAGEVITVLPNLLAPTGVVYGWVLCASSHRNKLCLSLRPNHGPQLGWMSAAHWSYLSCSPKEKKFRRKKNGVRKLKNNLEIGLISRAHVVHFLPDWDSTETETPLDGRSEKNARNCHFASGATGRRNLLSLSLSLSLSCHFASSSRVEYRGQINVLKCSWIYMFQQFLLLERFVFRERNFLYICFCCCVFLVHARWQSTFNEKHKHASIFHFLIRVFACFSG